MAEPDKCGTRNFKATRVIFVSIALHNLRNQHPKLLRGKVPETDNNLLGDIRTEDYKTEFILTANYYNRLSGRDSFGYNSFGEMFQFPLDCG